MTYSDLDFIWKEIFNMEWESLCEGSKAIAAVILDKEGNIISTGRNKIGQAIIPNHLVCHAEVEAVRNLDIEKYGDPREVTLVTALEPCPMCMGTIVMGRIRDVVIGAHDAHGGAVDLLTKSEFMNSKNVKVTWMPQIYGDIQRGLQWIRETYYNREERKYPYMREDFCTYNKKGVEAAEKLFEEGIFTGKVPGDYDAEFIVDKLLSYIEN